MPYGKRGTAVRIIYSLVATLNYIADRISNESQIGTIVLCYHGIKDTEQNKFAQQMRLVKNRALATGDLNSAVGEKTPALSVCVTFDDAYANLLVNALPTIKELQIPITIFVATKSIGSFPSWLRGKKHTDSNEMVMNESQILELKANPLITFGSHTFSHPRLSDLPEMNVREELLSSRNTLEKILKNPVENLALPHGAYNKMVFEIARETGYTKIFTLNPIPFIAVPSSTCQSVGRFSMTPTVWPVEFFLTINGAYSWLNTWRSFIQRTKNIRKQIKYER